MHYSSTVDRNEHWYGRNRPNCCYYRRNWPTNRRWIYEAIEDIEYEFAHGFGYGGYSDSEFEIDDMTKEDTIRDGRSVLTDEG